MGSSKNSKGDDNVTRAGWRLLGVHVEDFRYGADIGKGEYWLLFSIAAPLNKSPLGYLIPFRTLQTCLGETRMFHILTL